MPMSKGGIKHKAGFGVRDRLLEHEVSCALSRWIPAYGCIGAHTHRRIRITMRLHICTPYHGRNMARLCLRLTFYAPMYTHEGLCLFSKVRPSMLAALFLIRQIIR